MAQDYSTAYYIRFRISGMREDYPCKPRHSARTALDKIGQLSARHGFSITRIQERRGKYTKNISLSELEDMAKEEKRAGE